MKRNLCLGFLTLCLSLVATQSQGALVITGIIDGGLTGGLPKALELYATADIADLSIYTIDNANNGFGFDGTTIGLSGSVTAGSFLYVGSEDLVGGAPAFNSYFGFAPNFGGGSLNVNGDDVLGLFENSVLVDVFGVLGVDGTGEPWEYLDGWAYRVSNTSPSATFNLADWTFSGINVTDGTTTVGPTLFPIGTFTSSVAAIPEPSSIAALAILGGGAVVRRYRRRKTAVAV